MSGVWSMPVALGVLSLIGLASAIFGDGVWHWVCWAGLAVPLAVCALKLWAQWPGRA